MLKKILAALVIAVSVLLAVAYLLPRQVHVERAIVIDRPAAAVFPWLNSYTRFSEWSPWADLDPNARTTLSGPDSGVGARMAWSGNDKVGSGSQLITASVPDQSVTADLDFGRQGRAQATFGLAPAGAGTRLSWSLDVDLGLNPVGRYVGLALDGMIGRDYEKGLSRLKAAVEKAGVSR